ncbi:hypothetical protein BDW62DRAFT_197303 [Aspergillus aurantiobrunneus]
MPHSPLESLPIELQWSIIRLLDPIALISISQTNTHFRNVVSPKRPHFIERLLALECRAEVGGPPIHYSRHGLLDPDRNSPEWEANRWACTSCLRLLPHDAFNNQMLSRLCYRKPVPGSPAADRCTSWEPTSKSRKPGSPTLRDLRVRGMSYEERMLRKRSAIAGTNYWGISRRMEHPQLGPQTDIEKRFGDFQGCGMVEVEDMTFTDFRWMSDEQDARIFDRDAYAVELIRAGWNRHLRRCIECRFRRGEFRGCSVKGNPNGTVKVPIVSGRQKSYGTVVDRYFPGVSEVLENKRPDVNSPVFVVYRKDAIDRAWTTYRARCPGCSQWKELRAFRFGGIYPRWEPIDRDNDWWDGYSNWDQTKVTEEILDKLQCNHCFVKEHGREALGKVLVDWLECLLELELGEAASVLRTGLCDFKYAYPSIPKRAPKAKIKELICDIRPMLDKSSKELTRADVALLRQRRVQWEAWGDPTPKWLRCDKWYMEWLKYYEESETMWFWLKSCMEEIRWEGKGDILVDWVLNTDGLVSS